MANCTLGGLTPSSLQSFKAIPAVPQDNRLREQRIAQLDSIIAAHEKSLTTTKKALDNLLQSPLPYYTFPFTNVKMSPEQAEMVMRDSIEKFKALIDEAMNERLDLVKAIQSSTPSIEPYTPAVPGPIAVSTAPAVAASKTSPAIVESSPIIFKKYEEPPKEGSMLLPIALVGGAALSAYLMFKG